MHWDLLKIFILQLSINRFNLYSYYNFSLIKCYKKGFVLSVLAMAKWLFSLCNNLIIFPKIKPYFKDIIDNEYVLDIRSWSYNFYSCYFFSSSND